MQRKFSLEEKLAFISLVEQGQSARSVSDRFHLGHHILFEWLAAYKDHGIDGKHIIPILEKIESADYSEALKIYDRASDKVSHLRISITLLIRVSFLLLSTANVKAIETQFWVL